MARAVLYRVIYGQSNISNNPEAVAQASKITIQDAILHDHCRHHVKYADYPGMIPEKGKSVRGTYVTGLTDNNICSLDWFEGSQYVKIKVKPILLKRDGNGAFKEDEEVEAETYIWTAGEGQLDMKEEWDFEHFMKAKIQNWADYSVEYAGKWAVHLVELYLLMRNRCRRECRNQRWQ